MDINIAAIYKLINDHLVYSKSQVSTLQKSQAYKDKPYDQYPKTNAAFSKAQLKIRQKTYLM